MRKLTETELDALLDADFAKGHSLEDAIRAEHSDLLKHKAELVAYLGQEDYDNSLAELEEYLGFKKSR